MKTTQIEIHLKFQIYCYHKLSEYLLGVIHGNKVLYSLHFLTTTFNLEITDYQDFLYRNLDLY